MGNKKKRTNGGIWMFGNPSASIDMFNKMMGSDDSSDVGSDAEQGAESGGESMAESTKSSRVKRALYGDLRGVIRTFGIVSAENPWFNNGEKIKEEDKDNSAVTNNKRTERFLWNMKMMGLQYTRITGKYGSVEHSFVIYNPALADMEYLAYKFGQESFFFGKQGEDEDGVYSTIGFYKTENGTQYTLIEESERIDDAGEFDDFFSRVGDFKFSIYMKVFDEELKEVFNYDLLEDSINSSNTMRQRIEHRFLSRVKPKEKPMKETIDIREALNRADVTSDNEYDLLNRYLMLGLNESQKKEFAMFLAENHGDAESINRYMLKHYDGESTKKLSEQFENHYSENYILTTVEDILEGGINNMSDEQWDEDISTFRFVARNLPNKPKVVNVVVLVAGSEYDPKENFESIGGKWVKKEFGANHGNLTWYSIPSEGLEFIAESKDGNVYVYFSDYDDAQRYVEYLDSFIAF